MSKGRFITTDKKMWLECGHISNDKMGGTKYSPVNDLPYREATLCKHSNNGKVRYYIEFWAWHPVKKELTRKRLSYDLNKKKYLSKERRERRAQEWIDKINNQLERGLKIDTRKDKTEAPDYKRITIAGAYQLAMKIKTELKGLKQTTINNYRKHTDTFIVWLKENNLDSIKSHEFKAKHFQRFFDYLKGERNLGNKSHNLYLGTLRTLKNELQKRYPKLWLEDPLRFFEYLPVQTSMHAAYTNEQMATIKAYCQRHHPDLYEYIVFAYYTLARPTEIRHIKAGHIDLELGRILIKGETSKVQESYCGIAPALKQHIIDKKYNELPRDYYIFGKAGMPGPEPVGKNYFTRRNSPMLTALGFTDKRYTLYSYKHTGAISLYQATKDIKLLQAQLRHKKVSQTEDYLRDLGLAVGYSGLQKWQGAI